MNVDKNKEKSVKEKEIARLILQSKEFSKKYGEIKGYFSKIEKYLEDIKTKEHPENLIPISVFKTKKLGMLETAVKYLKEENKLTIDQISKLLKRKYTTIHSTYEKTKLKHPNKFLTKKGFDINATIFSDRKVSPLHSIISELKTRRMTFTQIAKALDRDIRNVSATYYKYKNE